MKYLLRIANELFSFQFSDDLFKKDNPRKASLPNEAENQYEIYQKNSIETKMSELMKHFHRVNFRLKFYFSNFLSKNEHAIERTSIRKAEALAHEHLDLKDILKKLQEIDKLKEYYSIIIIIQSKSIGTLQFLP